MQHILASLDKSLPPHPTTMIDASGFVRSVEIRVMGYIADLAEQLDVLGLRPNECPVCHAGFHQLGNLHPCEPQTSDSILKLLSAGCALKPDADVFKFARIVNSAGLLGVEHPFWEKLVGDFCRCICPDKMHGLYKYFGDHVAQWLSTTVRTRKLDNRMHAQPHCTGFCGFPNGISPLSQWTGVEERACMLIRIQRCSDKRARSALSFPTFPYPSRHILGADSNPAYHLCSSGTAKCDFTSDTIICVKRTSPLFSSTHPFLMLTCTVVITIARYLITPVILSSA